MQRKNSGKPGFSTLEPAESVTSERECLAQDDRASSDEDARFSVHHSNADMRGDSGISVAGADFSADAPVPEGMHAPSSTANSSSLHKANTWFAQACTQKLQDTRKRMTRAVAPQDLVMAGCVELMEHALAIARVLKIEMPGFVATLIWPDLAQTARQFASAVADGLDDFVCQVTGQPFAPHDDCHQHYYAATWALRGARPNLSVIWSTNPMFESHPSEADLLNAKVAQYTAKQEDVAG